MFKKVLMLVGSLVLPFLFVITTAQPAQADECPGKAQLRGDPWSEPARNILPSPVGGLLYDTYQMKAVAVYWYCPQGDLADKVRWVETRYVVGDVDVHYSFMGVRFDTWMWEDDTGNAVIPEPDYVNDDGTATLTGTFGILRSKQKWFQLRDNPTWQVPFLLRNNNWPDRGGYFLNSSGEARNEIQPNANTTKILSSWQ